MAINRNTTNLGAWVAFSVKDRAERDSVRLGYGPRGISAYVSDLILRKRSKKKNGAIPGPEFVAATLVRHPLVFALDVLEKYEAGEASIGEVSSALKLCRDRMGMVMEKYCPSFEDRMSAVSREDYQRTPGM